jgi:hypothetical protein
MTEVKVVADSINPEGQRIVTMTWKYPRYIHSEIMTHRMLVKNAASSRAIPIKRMLDMVISDPVIPIRWGKNQAGMQSMEWLEDRASDTATLAWLDARTQMVRMCNEFDKLQIHKQWANRVLEPWMHITVLVTGTEWGNFFNLRAHPDAHPDFQALAYRVLEMHEESKPKELNWGQWHLPFGDQMPEGIDKVPDDTDDYSLGWMAGDASIDTPAHPSVSYGGGGGASPTVTAPPPARPAGFRGLPSMPFSGRMGPAYGVFPAAANGKDEQIDSDPDGSAKVVLYFAPNSAMLENIHVLVVDISDVVIYETTDRTDVMITSQGNVDVHTLHVPVGTLPRQPAIWQIKVGNGPIRRFISGRNMR